MPATSCARSATTPTTSPRFPAAPGIDPVRRWLARLGRPPDERGQGVGGLLQRRWAGHAHDVGRSRLARYRAQGGDVLRGLVSGLGAWPSAGAARRPHVEFNEQNQIHRALVASGAVQPKLAVYDKLRCAFHIGPIRVQDRATNRRRFPYIPFFGYREDLTGVPYGIIRAMLSPQDEVNARSARMMWLLKSRRTFIDSDALHEKYNTMSDANRELGRADAFIVTNRTRRAARSRSKTTSSCRSSSFRSCKNASRRSRMPLACTRR